MRSSARDHAEAAGLVVLSFNALHYLTGKPAGLLVRSFKNASIGAVAGAAAAGSVACTYDAVNQDTDLLDDTITFGMFGSICGGALGFAGTMAWEALNR